jgi:hypothetical protein
VTALGDMVSDEDRARPERVRELADLDRLIREIPAQRPPDPVPALTGLAAHAGKRAS